MTNYRLYYIITGVLVILATAIAFSSTHHLALLLSLALACISWLTMAEWVKLEKIAKVLREFIPDADLD